MLIVNKEKSCCRISNIMNKNNAIFQCINIFNIYTPKPDLQVQTSLDSF